jgi:hypothetical protein
MTQDIITDLGEEQLIKNGYDALTVTVGVYNDSTDNVTESDDLAAITSEPSNTNYSTASVTFTASDLSGDWGVDNDSQFTFDFSDQTSSQNIDTFYIQYNFQAVDTGDGSATDHLIATAGMTQTRDIGSIDSLDVAAGDLSITVS